jgi:hypothetical protein
MGATGTVYVITGENDNIPEYIHFDRDYAPTGSSADPIRATIATLHFNAGRREKISRGDIVGFLIANSDLQAAEIGKIIVRDHSALVAIPASKLNDTLTKISTQRIKNQRVRITKIV